MDINRSKPRIENLKAVAWGHAGNTLCRFFSNSFFYDLNSFLLYSEKLGIFCVVDVEISADFCRLF